MIRKFLGKNKRRYARGVEYVGILFLISANAKLFEDFFRIHIGVNVIGAFCIIGSLYIFGCWIVGFLDERYGIWKEENDYGVTVTPKLDQLCKSVERIEDEIVGN